jgi:hypothetical protein
MNQSIRDLGPQGLCSTMATLGYFFATSDLRGSSPMDHLQSLRQFPYAFAWSGNVTHRRSVEGTTIKASLRPTPSAFAI